MGIPVLILGESGSGKSTSLRNFEPDDIGVFSVAGKRLPFRKKLPTIDKNVTVDYIMTYFNTMLKKSPEKLRKVYAIDDSQYLMSFYLMDRKAEAGYTKYTNAADMMRELVNYINTALPDDVIVYLLHHTETDTNTGKTKAKTVGKMLDNWITFEGLFAIVLYTMVDESGHWFLTQSDGTNTAKSPMDMFPDKVENDLRPVDAAIRLYYEL